MAKFFANWQDLLRWVKESFETEAEAGERIKKLLSTDRYDKDIAQSLNGIFGGEGAEQGAKTLFRLLASKQLVEGDDMANETKKEAGENDSTLKKVAYVEKFPERQLMEVRICPKLPRQGAAEGLVSTYDCRRFCSNSIVLDDDPHRVYCAEALWRRHVMDKFSRENLDPKTGLLQGGYINDRFVVCRDENSVGEPMNSPRMSLKPGERTREAKPYEYSTERRLEEQRRKGSTEPITLTTAETKNTELGKQAVATDDQIAQGAEETDKAVTAASFSQMTKLSSVDVMNPSDDTVTALFNESVEMHLAGVAKDDVLLKLAEKYAVSVQKVAFVQDFALRKLAKHQGDGYKLASIEKSAAEYLQIKPNHVIEAKNIGTGQVEKVAYKPNELFRESEKPEHRNDNVFQLWDTSRGTVKGLYQINPQDSALQPMGPNDPTHQQELARISYETGLSDNSQNEAALKKEEELQKIGQPEAGAAQAEGPISDFDISTTAAPAEAQAKPV